MRVLVKLLGFGFWLLSLNFAQCQECLRGHIKYPDIVPAEKVSYADGETVKVNCVTGYTGLYKLKCEKGEWKNTIERPCAKKKCSHPGDTPNGDFKLTEGTEFVFGATVVYKCKKGYEMASRINQRTCRAQGWDNAVPVCEVVKCPAIRTDEEVTVSGNAEEGSYGDIIRFECVSSDKMIDGSSEIHCDETGKWSDVAPKCKDITCTAPVIPNGNVVDSPREYKKDAPLKYKCYETFKPREGIPKCAKFGWTVKPECDEITCELKSTTTGVKKIDPDGKIIFRARESVEITCSEKHWIFFTKESRKTFTCKDDGKWDNEPVCAEITCDDPRDHLLFRPFYWGTMKLGEKQSYTCVYGYRRTEAEATCTRDGWTPKPLCTEIICDVPKIKNAEIVGRQRPNYRINSKEEYKCHSGFKPETPVQITCDSEGQWKDIQQCIEIMCNLPKITNAEIMRSQESNYKINSKVEYKCRSGFEPEKPVQITCDSEGKWRGIQQCTAMCAAPNITNAEIVGSQRPNYRISSKVQYKCLSGFEPEEPFQITCEPEGQWRGIQQCTKMPKLCYTLLLENGFIHKNSSNKEEIFYSCDTGYKPFSGNWWDSVTCRKGSQFDEPRCIREEECGALPSVHHGKLTLLDRETADVKCDPGFMSTERSINCIDGRWEKPVCKKAMRCGIPPNVSNAVITSKPEEFYLPKSTVTYVCRRLYLIRGESTVSCRNGKWEKTPTCQEITCELKSNTFGVKKINPEGKTIFRARESVEITCSEKYWFFGTKETEKTFTCKDDGKWDNEPVCAEITCDDPRDHLLFRPFYWGTMKLGEKQSYSCDYGYRQTAAEATCTRDGWRPKPLCTEIVCAAPNIPNAEIEGLQRSNYKIDSRIQYKCHPGFEPEESVQITCESQGQWRGIKQCTSQTTSCVPPPDVNDGDTIELKKDEYNTGERVEYSCFSKYTLDLRPPFSRYLTCEQGEWRGNIKCLKPCTVTLEEMERRGIELAYINPQKMFAPHNDHISFACQWRKYSVGVPLRQQCNDGMMTLPECE
ncbi:complement factor H-like isoform X2 [Carassius carassius]|uniref:complement factor H-like isoform X2 n=1 Tax=Carassius carassius TaxID=217509 RepID=UPI00286847F0|nr:complement factor H-like isoform X2 [Carassius carassius]